MIPRYTTKELKYVWSHDNRWRLFIKVETLYLEELEHLGIAPSGESEILKKIKLNPQRIDEIEKETGHEVVAFIKACEEQTDSEIRYIHYGLTSSDIMDTVFSLQLKEAFDYIKQELVKVIDALKDNALKYKGVAVIARTHGVHAEPTSLGLVFLGYYNEMVRNLNRLEYVVRDISVGKLSGAVGNLAYGSAQLEKRVLSRLGLRPEPAATQVVARDRYAEAFSFLAVLGGAIERFAVTLRNLQRTEVGEWFEPFGSKQAGSSAMPHKRNPVLAENLCGLSRLLRGYAVSAFENQALWMQRDISHSSVERVIGPDATTVAHFALRRLYRVINGMEIDLDAINRNLDMNGRIWASQCLLLKLIDKGLSRSEAYAIIQKLSKHAVRGGWRFDEIVLESDVLLRYLDSSEIYECFDEKRFLKSEDEIYKRSGLL